MPKKKKTETSHDVEVRGVDLREVERLLDFMQQHGLEEFDYESKGFHIRLKKQSPAGEAMRMAAPADLSRTLLQSEQHDPSSAGGTKQPGAVSHAADVHVVKSPIVGTFYVAPSPEAEPFVKVGTRVEKGQALGIIEAMKLMNEIESDVAGEIVQIFVENGNPVEYGEPLFGIRTQQKK